MNPLFVAAGPLFKKNYTSKMFNNTDIYVLMCTILGLQPAQNNGSFDNIKDLLVDYYVPIRSTEVMNFEDTKTSIRILATFENYFLFWIVSILFAYFVKVLYFKKRNQLSVRADQLKI
jgi:hypothetical protein